MAKTRRFKRKVSRRRRKRSLKRGGANNAPPVPAEPVPVPRNNQNLFDCSAEGFDIEMREAAFGNGYRFGVGGVHDDGEQWSYDHTAERLLGGMVDWYRRTLEERNIITPYTEGELIALNNNEVLKDLSVFYNRYKIVAEKLPLAINLFNGGIQSIYTNFFPAETYVGPASFATMLSNIKQNGSKYKLNGYEKLKINSPVIKSLEILSSYKDIDFSIKDLPIEIAIDRAQCIIFYIVKHKGQFPPGFVMDERISRRAHEELKMSIPFDILKRKEFIYHNAKLFAVERWLSFLNIAYDELSEHPVTFGLRWNE
jgi:hypothetical protein